MKITIYFLSIIFIIVECTIAQNKNDEIKWQGTSTGGDTVEGIVWYSPIQLSPDSISLAHGPSIVAQGDTIHITWTGVNMKFPYLRSVNGGRSFEPLRQLLPDSLGIVWNCYFVFAGSRVHAFMAYSKNNGTTYYNYSMFSDDAGIHWSSPKRLSRYFYPWSYSGRGDTVILMHSDGVMSTTYTTDGGSTWIEAASVIHGRHPYITFANGVVHLVNVPRYRIQGLPEFIIQYKRSTDLGNTWSDSLLLCTDTPGQDMACIAADPEANPGNIISVWRSGKYGCLTELGCSQVGSWSFDNGTTWQPQRRFDIVPAGYSTGAKVKDSIIVVSWIHNIPWDNGHPLITVSTNGAQSWTTPYAVSFDTNFIIGYSSSIAVSNGTLHVGIMNYTGGNGNWKDRVFYRRGVILSAQRPRYRISSRSFSYQETKVLCSTTIPVVVKNTGGAILDVQSVVSNDTSFTVLPTNGRIDSYDSLIFNVTFSPKISGVKSGAVIFTHNGSGSPDTVNVSGIGTEAGVLSVAPKDILFGDTSISCRISIPITVKNNICTQLVVESEVLDDSSFDVTPASATINPLDSLKFLITFQPARTGVKTARVIFTHDGPGLPDTISVTGTGTGSTATAVINNYYGIGWQMISLPVSVLCPYTANNLFAYTSSYVQKDTLNIGTGYWQKLKTPTLRFVGFTITDDTLQVRAGWNMIGSISSPVAVSDIQSIPGGVTISNVFGYNGTNYFTADTIYPGRGYWVKVREEASLILSTLGQIFFQKEILSTDYSRASRVKIVHTDEQPPPPPNGKIHPPLADPKSKIPQCFTLEQNYPNPFNPKTNIEFRIPALPSLLQNP